MADDNPGISVETAEMLDAHVKKGKARKFFLIYKGASIKTLVVFKKGPFGPKIMKAKKDGFKGEVVCGTITGKGKNLLLQLPGNATVADAMQAEGTVDKEPTKKTKLKQFLADNGLRLKPEYEIITELDQVLDPESDDEVSVPGLDAADDDEPSGESGNIDTVDPATATAAFKDRLQSILPRVKAAGDTVAADATQLVREATESAKQGSFGEANEKLDDVETLLTDAPASEASASADDELGKKLAEAVKKVKPLMVAAIKADPSRKSEIQGTIVQISGEIKAKQYDRAKNNVKEFVSLLKSLAAKPTSSSSGKEPVASGESSEGFSTKRDKLEPQFLEAKKAVPDRATKLAAAWDYANQQAQDGNFNKALTALRRLDDAVQEILAAPARTDAQRLGIEEGIADKRKFLLSRFKQIPFEIKPHLDAMKLRIIDADADGNPAELTGMFDSALQTLLSELQSEIDNSIKAGDSSRVSGLRDRITKNEVVQLLLRNPFTDGSKFESTILTALDEIEQKLAG